MASCLKNIFARKAYFAPSFSVDRFPPWLKKEDREIMKLLDESAVTYQVVLTKIDKISEKALSAVSLAIIEELKKHAAAMPEPLATSSEKKIGLDILKAEVCSFMK